MLEGYVSMSNNVIRNNEVVSTRVFHDLQSKRNTCGCAICGKTVKPYEGERVTTPSHPRGITLCDEHVNMFNNLDFSTYSDENTTYIGKETAKGMTCSFECETIENTTTSICSMVVDLHFLPSHDSSLGYKGIEYKSPIFNSLNSTTKTLGTIEALVNEGYFDTKNDSCGGHIHTGFYNDPIDFTGLYNTMNEYWEVFKDLYVYLDNMPNETMKLYFGRGFSNYARTIRKTSNGFVMPCHNGNGKRLTYYDKRCSFDRIPSSIHEIIFNVQHDYSIEFRLPKFINAIQYRTCILSMQEIMDVLRKNDFKYSPSLVKVFEKYFPY